MKRISVFALLLCFPLLASFKSAPLVDAKLFDDNNVENEASFSVDGETHELNKEYDYDLGRRNSALGQKLRWKVTSYKIYEIGERHGYILDYGAFFNPYAISGYERSFETTLSTEYSVLFSHQVTTEFAGYFGTILGIDDLVEVKNSSEVSQSTTDIVSYGYTYGETKTTTSTYTFDFSACPSDYVVAPCLVCNAVQITIEYSVLNHWWWGDYGTYNKEEVDQTRDILVYRPGSLMTTYAIRWSGDDNPPHIYRNAIAD